VPVYLCRACGALHPDAPATCRACGRPGPLVTIFVVRQDEKHPGYLTSCLSCAAPGHSWGGGYREPARPVRAVTVSDVHVLAQNMLHSADRKRLLVFADNRQEAAFQAGWMQDHARRYRLRALMARRIKEGPVSVGDLTAFLDDLLDRDDELSSALVPEVWRLHRKEAAGQVHARERRRFLRIQVLREIATGVKQRVGLEPWGRMKIDYLGLVPDLRFVQRWAARLAVEPDRLVEGIAALLDNMRRRLLLLDREGKIFSKFWMEGDPEIQYGFLPLMKGVPTGLKLEREPDDHHGRVTQWWSARGETGLKNAVRGWGLDGNDLESFVRGLWELLAEEIKILAPVTLTGARGRALPGCTGVRQIDADLLHIAPTRGL
jgi:hypothetical protein